MQDHREHSEVLQQWNKWGKNAKLNETFKSLCGLGLMDSEAKLN